MSHLVTFVDQDEEQVEPGHDGRRQGDVLTQRFGSIVAAADGIGSGQYRSTGVESRFDSSLQHNQSIHSKKTIVDDWNRPL